MLLKNCKLYRDYKYYELYSELYKTVRKIYERYAKNCELYDEVYKRDT